LFLSAIAASIARLVIVLEVVHAPLTTLYDQNRKFPTDSP